MRITIDNLDGLGALDYSCWISTAGPLRVKRALNAPSTCEGVLDLNSSTLGVPSRKGRVIVSRDDGAVLFTGYVATEPELIYAGVGTTGTAYRVGLHAISDEWLLDRQGSPTSGAGLGQSGLATLRTLTSRVSSASFSTSGTGNVRSVGVYQPEKNGSWSANAGVLANSVYAAYRVVGGAITLQTAGTVTHVLSDGEGSLQTKGLRVSQTRELANDVTVSGDIEPAAYISESFAGDGATSVFTLAKTPFRYGASGASPRLISDSFDQGAFDRRIWNVSDPGSHFSFTATGLTLSGGNGMDGQTTLEAIDAVELGGAIVLEMGAVQIGSASDGVLCGLYKGNTSRGTCFAGYSVRQSNGSTVLAPLVNGVETGTLYTLQSGHTYTLRVRVHCVEAQRVRQIYYAMVSGSLTSFGGGVVSAPVDLVFDLQDNGASSNTPATILYQGTVQDTPGSCSFVPVNSIQLIGSAGYCRATQTGSTWVTKTSAAGVRAAQLAGVAGEGVDYTISASGKVTFLAGRVPQAGELVTVSYRLGQRAIVRMEDPGSVAAEAKGGVPGTSQWLGKVVQPAARSTVDCESAAEALLSVANGASGGRSGSYVAFNPEDMWPGDVLSVSHGGEATSSIVRGVTIEDGLAVPELVTYHVTFASEWAEGLGIRVSEAMATDVILPQTAQTRPGSFLSNLQQVMLISASGTALQIDAGVTPPAGGGFEVRRRDGGFGAGADQDLVLRSPVRGFAIPREAQVEQYYVRMYDGSTPPVYSRLSGAIFTDIPVG